LGCRDRCKPTYKGSDRTDQQPIADPSPEDIDDLYQTLNADALKFHSLFYDEIRHLQTLDQQRQISFSTSH
jgi:hypothetical protein